LRVINKAGISCNNWILIFGHGIARIFEYIFQYLILLCTALWNNPLCHCIR